MSSKNSFASDSNISQEQTMMKDIQHIGIVVKDIEETAKYFRDSLGISFNIKEMQHSGTLHNKPMNYKANICC